GLSARTQEADLRAVRKLADHFHTPPDRLTEHQVRDYFLHRKIRDWVPEESGERQQAEKTRMANSTGDVLGRQEMPRFLPKSTTLRDAPGLETSKNAWKSAAVQLSLPSLKKIPNQRIFRAKLKRFWHHYLTGG